MSYKGKEAMPIPEPKKAKPMPREMTIIATRPVAPREGTSVNHVAALEPKVTMLRNSAIIEKTLEACIPPFDKEEMDKLELDRMISKLFSHYRSGNHQDLYFVFCYSGCS